MKIITNDNVYNVLSAVAKNNEILITLETNEIILKTIDKKINNYLMYFLSSVVKFFDMQKIYLVIPFQEILIKTLNYLIEMYNKTEKPEYFLPFFQELIEMNLGIKIKRISCSLIPQYRIDKNIYIKYQFVFYAESEFNNINKKDINKLIDNIQNGYQFIIEQFLKEYILNWKELKNFVKEIIIT